MGGPPQADDRHETADRFAAVLAEIRARTACGAYR